MFRPIEAIVRYIELLQTTIFLYATPHDAGQCLHIGSVLYTYVVYVMPYVIKYIKYKNLHF
jgi:hypothetical protein